MNPNLEYPKMGFKHWKGRCPSNPDYPGYADGELWNLAQSLEFPPEEIEAQQVILPDGTQSLNSDFRSKIMTRAILNRFSSSFAGESIIVYLSNSNNKSSLKNFINFTHNEMHPNSSVRNPDIVIHLKRANQILIFDLAINYEAINERRQIELLSLFTGCAEQLVLISAFETQKSFGLFEGDIVWGTHVWIAETPDHMIHFNGLTLAGPYRQSRNL